MAGYLIDDESMARLAKMLIAYEGGQFSLNGGIPGGEQESGYSAPIVHPVRVTSLTTDANGTYPGKLLRYYPGTNTYYDHSDIRIRDVNSDIPEVQRYLGRLGGLTSGSEPMYLIQVAAAVVESGSGSGSGSEGSESGSTIESGSIAESGSVSGSGSISGSVIESGSVSGSQFTIEVVTNVECVDGELIITKTTLTIPGGSAA